ncbi:MAG: hypothetical protein N2Z57_05805 [Oscillospiraceae bacterium]|nr:hypothetical protein [Oscillospiraceae bacterium]
MIEINEQTTTKVKYPKIPAPKNSSGAGIMKNMEVIGKEDKNAP